MNFKLKTVAAAVLMGLGSASYAGAGVIDGYGYCQYDSQQGLGEETCEPAAITRAEGVLFTAAEQIVSMASAITDNIGCQQASLSDQNVVITTYPEGVYEPGAIAFAKLGNFEFVATEKVYDGAKKDFFGVLRGGYRRHATYTYNSGSAWGKTLDGLYGDYRADGSYSIMKGASDFYHGGAGLDEAVIKDFYLGEASKYDPNSTTPWIDTLIVRDNGLEVTTKKSYYDDVYGYGDFEGAPKSKWLQTSFYRRPNGQGGFNGHLTFVKTRIAPYHGMECMVTLDLSAGGNADESYWNGKVEVMPSNSY